MIQSFVVELGLCNAFHEVCGIALYLIIDLIIGARFMVELFERCVLLGLS